MNVSLRRSGVLLVPTLTLWLAACGGEASEAASEAPSTPEAATAETAAPAGAALLDPNDAARDQLLAADGLTEPAVDALIAGRPYGDMLEVDAVLARHLDEAQRETVYAAVWKPLDLNAATEAEILLIPGVEDRMAHEFEEYRPYRAMAEFHREIGKYVDEAEVERLARYVELR